MRSRSYILLTILLGGVFNSPLLYAQLLYSSADDDSATNKSYFEQQTKQFSLYAGTDLSMGLGFRASNLSYSDATALIDATATPKIGFFPISQLMIGGNFDFFGSLASFNARDSYALYSQTWGGFLRYYLKGGFFGEAQYSRGRGYERTNQQGVKQVKDFQTERYSIGVGIANFWTEHFNFEVLLKYNSSHGAYNDTRGIYLSSLSLTAGIGFTLGNLKSYSKK